MYDMMALPLNTTTRRSRDRKGPGILKMVPFALLLLVRSGNAFVPSMPYSPALTMETDTCQWASVANDVLDRLYEDEEAANFKHPSSTVEFLKRLQVWDSQIGSDPDRLSTNLSLPAVNGVLGDLDALLTRYDSTRDPQVEPSAEIFRLVLRILSASRERGIDRKAQGVFLEMQDHYNIEPDPEMYEYLIRMLAKARRGAKRAESFLREALERYPHGQIGINSFNVVLTAWAKSGLEYGPERAEKLLVLMEELNMKPTVESFTSLLDAYAQTNTWEGVGRSEGILNRVLEMYLNGDDTFEPSVVSWTIVMSAWVRLAKKNNRGAGKRADRLLTRMEDLHSQGSITFGPDAIAYITCMNALAHTKVEEDLYRARELLDEMQEKYLDGDDSFKPTLRSVRVLIDSWIRSEHTNRMDEAEDIFLRYKDALPELTSETLSSEVASEVRELNFSMLCGWCQVGAPAKAYECLVEMSDKNRDLDSICFDRVIECNTQTNGPVKRAIQVFELLESRRLAGLVVPNERVYTSFIRALTKARVPNLAQRASAILGHMEDLSQGGNKGVKPSVFTFNAMLVACAESYSADDPSANDLALKIALSAFGKIRAAGPDHVSFGNMLRCSQLVPEGPQRDSLITSTFQLCCQSGLVNDFCLRDLKLSASDELCLALVGVSKNEDVPLERLPASWSRQDRKRRAEKELRKRDNFRSRENRRERRGRR